MIFINGFAKEEFLQFMHEEFPNVFDNSFSRDMLENIVDYGVKNHTTTKNGLYYFLKEIIPELEPKDIIKFIDPDCLTDEVLSLAVKQKEVKVSIKINRYICKIGKNDYIFDNGSGITVPTQKHFEGWYSVSISMSRKLLNQLKSCGFVYVDERLTKKANKELREPRYTCYRFDVEKMLASGQYNEV